jgi:Mg2+ and Co2+ transporter CorA
VRIETAYEEKLEAELIEQREEFVEKVDSYLNYVVEQWMEENKVAIQQGLRTEIAENFMNNLKDLFVESYIDVPESKIDLVDDMADQIEELEEQLFKTTSDAIKLSEEVTNLKRESIIAEASADLAETQAEKFASLVSDLDFDDAESFAEKVLTVKESYFSRTNSTEEIIEESADEPSAYETEVEVAPTMERYLQAMRTVNRD